MCHFNGNWNHFTLKWPCIVEIICGNNLTMVPWKKKLYYFNSYCCIGGAPWNSWIFCYSCTLVISITKQNILNCFKTCWPTFLKLILVVHAPQEPYSIKVTLIKTCPHIWGAELSQLPCKVFCTAISSHAWQFFIILLFLVYLNNLFTCWGNSVIRYWANFCNWSRFRRDRYSDTGALRQTLSGKWILNRHKAMTCAHQDADFWQVQ